MRVRHLQVMNKLKGLQNTKTALAFNAVPETVEMSQKETPSSIATEVYV